MGNFGPVLAGHIAAGDVATTYVWRALGDTGHSDLVQTMILQPDAPSYANMIASGLTTIPENWRYDKTRSWNHDMYAGILEWFYRDLAGISALKPGYEEIQVKPSLPAGLKGAAAMYDSVRGRIVSTWHIDGTKITLGVQVPPNATAIVHVPADAALSVREGSQPAEKAPGVKFVCVEPGAAVFSVGSGVYVFDATLPTRTP